MITNVLDNERLQENVQITIELQSLILKYKGDFSLLLIEG